jgi:hypothetical protein
MICPVCNVDTPTVGDLSHLEGVNAIVADYRIVWLDFVCLPGWPICKFACTLQYKVGLSIDNVWYFVKFSPLSFHIKFV